MEAVNTNFYSLWFDPTGNRTQVYRFSSRRSIYSTTDPLYSSKAKAMLILNSSISLHTVDDALRLHGTKREIFALLLTDAARYMSLAAKL